MRSFRPTPRFSCPRANCLPQYFRRKCPMGTQLGGLAAHCLPLPQDSQPFGKELGGEFAEKTGKTGFRAGICLPPTDSIWQTIRHRPCL